MDARLVRWAKAGSSGTWFYDWSATDLIHANEERDYMEVYEYIIVYTGDDSWAGAKILAGPVTLLASDEGVVRMEAARAIPDGYADRLDDIDIHVRKWAA